MFKWLIVSLLSSSAAFAGQINVGRFSDVDFYILNAIESKNDGSKLTYIDGRLQGSKSQNLKSFTMVAYCGYQKDFFTVASGDSFSITVKIANMPQKISDGMKGFYKIYKKYCP